MGMLYAPMPKQPSTPARPQAEHVRVDFDPAAGVAAILFPGLGYFVSGAPRRGVYLMVGVLSLVVLGLFIGGLDVVDRVNDRWWFFPQAGLGPLAFFLDYLHRGPLNAQVTQSIGRANEVGTLFVVLGGMCNIIAVIDCFAPTIRDKPAQAAPKPGPRPQPVTAPATPAPAPAAEPERGADPAQEPKADGGAA